jgi:hypothetical protein
MFVASSSGLFCRVATSAKVIRPRVSIRNISVTMGSKDTIFNIHSIVEKDESSGSSHLKSILEGNKKWVAQRKQEDPEFFDKLAKPQTPKYLYFGCSDSRVPANQILGKG